MALLSNRLQKKVDLPSFEWTRPLPIVASTGLNSSCTPDNPQFNEATGRYIYMLLNATNFWRYDTIADTYLQLASPGITPLTATSLQFAGATGYYGEVISAGSNNLTTGLPFSASAEGYRIRIISGKGSGQTRLITSVSDPVIADFGGASAGSTRDLTDSTKNWGWTGTNNNFNIWKGYALRIVGGTGVNQVRKILYNSPTVLTIADVNLYAYNTWSAPATSTAGVVGWTSPTAGSLYQIESSTITVDTPWDVVPDNTSRYVIQSGGIFAASGATAANGLVTLQYYSILEDIWYMKSSLSNGIPNITITDITLERITENSTLWHSGRAIQGSNTSLTDSTDNWNINQWAGYYAFFWTGTGRGQIAPIANNTSNTLNFSTSLSPSPDSTTRYDIYGYDAGILTSSLGRIVFDSTKNWTLNRWRNGFAIRILSGRGIGQVRQIMSNGFDSLVLYENWNVQPDNTSVYAIVPWSQDMYITVGGSAQTLLYRVGDIDIVSHGRILDEGVVQVATAIPVDGSNTASHEVYEQKPIPISTLSGTTTITANTAVPHPFRANQWVSIRGVTSGALDMANVTGKVQILAVTSANGFTYTPFVSGSGTYQYSNNAPINTSSFPDASKYHADLATGGSTTTATFARAQPSNINGWYAYGTNIGDGAQVLSGAGTTTLTFNVTGAGTPSGIIIFTKAPRPVTSTYSSGGGAGVFSMTTTGAIPAYVKGWLATGTNLGLSGIVVGGEGTTTPFFSIQQTGTPSGTITFSYPVNNPLPNTGTYSSGSGTSIVLTGNTPSYLSGWFVSGTNISNGTTVVGGAGSNTITLSTATSGTPSGTITFYPPSMAPAMYIGSSGAPANLASGLLSVGNPMQLIAQSNTNGIVLVPISPVNATTAGTSRYIVIDRDAIFQEYSGQNVRYLAAIANGVQATTALVDTNSFWSTATGSGGSAGANSFTLSAAGSPIHNGWFVTGTNIALGSRVVRGGGTTTITVDQPLSGTVSGTITFTAWSPQVLTNRRLRMLSGTGLTQELTITSANGANGSIFFSAATAGVSGVTNYAIMPTIVPGAGSTIRWISDSQFSDVRGVNLFRFRGGASVGIDKLDTTTDQFTTLYTIPITETLTSGTMYAYDQYNRIYFTKDLTNRLYYLDTDKLIIHGAGQFPYLAGSSGIGNRMEFIITEDNLKYLWINRQLQLETYKQLIFY